MSDDHIVPHDDPVTEDMRIKSRPQDAHETKPRQRQKEPTPDQDTEDARRMAARDERRGLAARVRAMDAEGKSAEVIAAAVLPNLDLEAAVGQVRRILKKQ
jgi:hypothetical protein